MHGRNFKGFTLIELLVVISIIALLSSVVLASLNTARDKAKVAQTAAELREIIKALALYQADNGGSYPCFDHNWSDTAEIAWSAPYIKWPRNPWGGAYHWEDAPYSSGMAYSISIQAPGAAAAAMLDKMMDDGAPSTGLIRYSDASTRVEYGGMDQTVPSICS